MPNKIVAWRRINDQEASLDKMLKEYEKTSGKLQKAKAGKTGSIQAELDQSTAQIASLSPLVYTTFQRLDEERLKSLKEVIVRWGTIRGDMAGRDGERAERATGNMLAWETGDEVLGIGRKIGGVSGSNGASAPAPSLQGTRETALGS